MLTTPGYCDRCFGFKLLRYRFKMKNMSPGGKRFYLSYCGPCRRNDRRRTGR